MGTASKKPPELSPMREYKAHFELWDEAAIDDADAPPFGNGRRVWTTPVLSTTPIAAPRPRKRAASAPQPWSAAGYWTLAVIAIGAVLIVLMMRPWKSAKAPVPPVKIAPRAAMKVRASPKGIPSVAVAARQAAAASAPKAMASLAAPATAAAAPVKPLAMPSVAALVEPAAMASIAAPLKSAAAPSLAAAVTVAAVPVVKAVAKPAQIAPTIEIPLESPSTFDKEEEEDEIAPVRGLLLESSLKNQLTSAGYPSLGVSVTGGGDVFLNGTFLNLADEDRVLAMVRGHEGVRDIYFSGTVWHDATGHEEQATAPGAAAAPAAAANAASASPPSQPLPAKPPAPAPQPVPSAQGKIAHSTEFPVTAAEIPATSGSSAYAPSAMQPSAPAQTRPPSANSPEPEVDESGDNPTHDWDASLPVPKPIARSTP
jgi:hypothetical protein